jgi:lipopolysaccharide export system protein LptA
MRGIALLLVLALAQQAKDKIPQDTLPKDAIKDWKYQRKDPRHDVKTGKEIEEITVILAGDEAVAVNFDKKIFDLRGVKARYFTDPAPGKDSEEMVVVADRGRYDHEARTLKLEDRVRVVKKNDDKKTPQNDTVLTASQALLRFNRVYECPTCRKLPAAPAPVKAPGKCAVHDEKLREATVTSVEVAGEFNLAGPEGILSGDGLVTDDAIHREYHITRNGFLEFGSESSAVLNAKKAAPVAPQARFAQIFSRGPLKISGGELDRVIQGSDGMRVDRIDSTGTLTLRARTMEILAIRKIDPETGKLTMPEVREVDARGSVVMEGVVFEDSSAFRTQSETLSRTLTKDDEIIKLTSSEIPVNVESGPDTIEARAVTITRGIGQSGGVSVFEHVLNSKLRAGDQHFALRCDTLTTYAEPNTTGKTDLRRLKAEGRVGLGGLMAGPEAKGAPGEAQADYFEWDVLTRRGWMTGKPFVRITQGPSTIVAPMVVIESPSIIVLKGPKDVHLVQEREGGKKEEYRATCEGDLVMDQATHRLRMRDRCSIRTKEMVLQADRVNATLTEDGKGLESLLALGKVRALQLKDHTTLYGDRLAFRFKDQDLRVYGEPYAVADTGNSSIRQEQIRVYEKKHPKTGQMIRYTEFLGGRDGVHIEIEEKTKK